MTAIELKTLMVALKERLESLEEMVMVGKQTNRLNALVEATYLPDFWSDRHGAQAVIAEQNSIKATLQELKDLKDLFETIEITEALAEEDPDLDLSEAEEAIRKFELKADSLHVKTLLNQPYDRLNAIVEFHPGAGGTESQDWAAMLYRMILRWSESHDYHVSVLDYQDGEEAGLKSATLLIEGLYAYGYLKAESGVHRLVRISPFDSSGRRHTSFASLSVIPETDEDIDVDIQEEDLKIDTYRSSGNGGQGVNTTDSAVRITHLPTRIVVTCQNERSQIQNRETAMKVLKAKLYQLELEKKQKELNELSTTNVHNAFGSQIRSYVFMPYTMVKDHRTGMETGNVGGVMNGDLDPFIHAYLLQAKRA